MKAVLANAGLHVGSPEPHRATASKWRISPGKHNLLIGAHAQDFVRLDQRTAGQLLRSGSGRTPRLDAAADLIEPDDAVVAVGSGGSFAMAGARALVRHSSLSARQIAEESMRIAADICIYTNPNLTIEEL